MSHNLRKLSAALNMVITWYIKLNGEIITSGLTIKI